jgi:hypothetical protein
MLSYDIVVVVLAVHPSMEAPSCRSEDGSYSVANERLEATCRRLIDDELEDRFHITVSTSLFEELLFTHTEC